MSTQDDALAAPSITWLKPKVHADWRVSNTYGGDLGLDDLSEQQGDSYTVVQSFDDGLPDTVTATSGANASGTLSLPNVIGRYGVRQRFANSVAGQVTSSDAGDGTSTQGVVPALDGVFKDQTQVIWVTWRGLTPGTGAAARMTLKPEGYDVIIDQFTDGDLNFMMLARVQVPQNIVHEDRPVFYFSTAVTWQCGFMQFQVLDLNSRWMPARIVSPRVARTTAYGTAQGPPSVTTGSDGSSGGIPVAIVVSYGAGGAWVQTLPGGFQLSGSTAAGKLSYAFLISGPSGVATLYASGAPATYTMGASTTLPFGPSLQTNDGGFETFAGWTATGCTFAQSAVQAHTGTKSGLLTAAGAVSQATWRNSAQIAATAGSTYRASCWAWATGAQPNVAVSIDWYDASHAFISSTSTPVTLPASAWTRLDTGAVTAPVGAAFATYGGTLSGTPAVGTLVYWDDVDFRGGEAIMASFSLEGQEYDQLDARQYFSPFTPNSPVKNFDRDVAPMIVQQGVLADDGPQFTQIYTGQMASVAIAGRTADIEGVSATRIRMMQAVQLPLVNGATMGANMTWPVTYCMHACGLYAAPPPTPFARYYATMHGSFMYNMGDAPTGLPYPTFVTRYSDPEIFPAPAPSQVDNYQPTSVDGPFVLGMYGARQANFGVLNQMAFRPAQSWWGPLGSYRPAATYTSKGWHDGLSQANSEGRFSIWVRGDTSVVTPTKWGITQDPGALVKFRMSNVTASVQQSAVECGIKTGSTFAQWLYVRLTDNHGNDTTFTGVAVKLPNDGNWHYCTFSWNWAAGTAKLHIDNLDEVPTGTFAGTTADLPITELGYDAAGGVFGCTLDAMLPISEAMLECGTGVYASAQNWSPIATAFAPTAVVRAVDYTLNAIVEPAPLAAWDILVKYAKAALAMFRCDELDRVCWLPPSYFGEPLLTQIATDSFSRTLASSWGTADLGGDWALGAGTYSVSGNRGTMTLGAVGAVSTAQLGTVTAQDYDLVFQVRPQIDATGGEMIMDIATRYIDPTHYLALQIRFETDTTCDAYIVKNQGAGEVTLGVNLATALTYNNGQIYWMRCKAEGSIIRLKMWNVQNIEPSAWTLVAQDSAPQPGGFVLRAQRGTGNTNVAPAPTFDNVNIRRQFIEVISTETNAQDLDLVEDPSRVRNDVTVQFTDTVVATNQTSVLDYATAITIPKGGATLVFALDKVQAQTWANPLFSNLSVTNVTNTTFPGNVHWAAFNTKPDGTGSYVANNSTGISAKVIEVDSTSVTVQFTNFSKKTLYMVHNNANGMPFMSIRGYPVTAVPGYTTVRDQSSIDVRGDRTVSSELGGIQLREDATAVAHQLLLMRARPRATVQVHVMGNPNRVPGQLVQIADPQGTAASGIWMILAVQHNRNGAEYTQDLSLIQALPTGDWDLSNWDEAAWGE